MSTISQNKALAARLQEVLLDGHWVANTNLKEQLLHITHPQATTRIAGLHTIAELTWHINYYLSGILRAFQTGTLDIHDKYSFDCPLVGSETEWHNLRNELIRNAEGFTQAVAQMPPTQLSAPFIQEKYGDYQRNINGMIEHCYYHLGQMVLIRKLMGG